MTCPMHELIHLNLQDIFGEGNASRSRASIDALYTEDAVLHVPPAPIYPYSPQLTVN